MIETVRETSATPAQVWAVLSDGWLYASWVVGASRIRAVEKSWPAVDAAIHHSVGSWPVLLDDETVVLESRPNSYLKLKAKGRPAGEAVVEIELVPTGGGCKIHMREDAVSGPGKLIPGPIRRAAILPRNKESLQRLTYLAEGRAR